MRDESYKICFNKTISFLVFHLKSKVGTNNTITFKYLQFIEQLKIPKSEKFSSHTNANTIMAVIDFFSLNQGEPYSFCRFHPNTCLDLTVQSYVEKKEEYFAKCLSHDNQP